MTARAGAGALLKRRLSKLVEWDDREREILSLAMAQADDIERLEALLSEQGLSIKGSTGQIRMNPLVTEIRLQRAQQAKYLEQLRIPSDDAAVKDPKKQAAAKVMHDRRIGARGTARLTVVND